MEIDRSAPVVAAAEEEIATDAQTVWDLIAAVDRWPSWNEEVKSASVEGRIAEGAVFRWKTRTGTITSRLRELDRPRRVAWTGRTFGIATAHVWTLEPRGERTLVTSTASFDGLLARALRLPLRKMLQRALDGGLRMLASEAERRVPA
jgi:uncharacterized protein YndB with AHSA1/START domain